MAEADGPQRPLVSVIIPVHNAAAYLQQCLDSVLNQTLRGIEVIAVDDASTDASPTLLAEIQARDDRLRIETFRNNRGVSAARNAGLATARGEFVAFVDADDYVELSMYETMLAAARSLVSEVVSCGIDTVDQWGAQLNATPFPMPAGLRHDPEEMRERLHEAFAVRMLWYPVRSLYSRDLLVRQGLFFDKGVRKGEDSLFNLKVLHFADGVCCIPDVMYHYRQHAASATARPLASESENLANLAKGVLGFYAELGDDERARRDFYRHVLRSDLPTALVRLDTHPDRKRQIRELTHLAVVRDAFCDQPLRDLHVPGSVLVLLAAARARMVGVLTVAVRARAMKSPRSQSTRRTPMARRAQTDRPRVALTFDDGPGEGTDLLLSILADEGVSATFFVVGESVARFPEVMVRLANSEGVEMGSHTSSHADLTKASPEAIAREIGDNADLIRRVSGLQVRLFRPPWGRHNETVDAAAHAAGQSLILYTLDSGDWSHHSTGETVRRVAETAADGDIILLHDTLPSTIEASRPLIQALKARGFELVTVTGLLGPTLPGHSYDGLVVRRVRVVRWWRRQVGIFLIRARRVLGAIRRIAGQPWRS